MIKNPYWFVYIVRCKDGTLYTGITNDLPRRIDKHNNGRGAKYTKGRLPVKLVWSKVVNNKSEALKEEIKIKKLSKIQKEKLLSWSCENSLFEKNNILLKEFKKYIYPVPIGLDEINQVFFGTFLNKNDKFDLYSIRHNCCLEIAWAIPSEEAIKKIISYGPVVEMGAGAGYWASLIKLMGGTIKAYDVVPVSSGLNFYALRSKSYFPVKQATPKILTKHKDNLLLCWPPYEDPMAFDCLKYWKGDLLFYIGEVGGCTADIKFHDKLKSDFELLETVIIPQWPGITDKLTIWKRK